MGFSLSRLPGHPGACHPSTTAAYKSTVYQVLSELGPANASPRPPRHGRRVNAKVDQVNGLLAAVQQQLGLAGVGRAGRVVLDQDVGRAPQVGMLDVKGYLVRRQVDLSPALDHLELHHHEHPMRERHQDVRDAQVHAGFNPGEMAVWDIVPDPFVQVRFWFQGHLVLPRRALR